MRLTINQVSSDPELIWVILNDFKNNMEMYSSESVANELSLFSMLSVNQRCDQNFDFIYSDHISATLKVAKSLGFKSAAVLLPGAFVSEDLVNKIKHYAFTKESIVHWEEEFEKDSTGFLINLQAFENLKCFDEFDCFVTKKNIKIMKSTSWLVKKADQKMLALYPIQLEPPPLYENYLDETTENKSMNQIQECWQKEQPKKSLQPESNVFSYALSTAMRGHRCYLYNNERISQDEVSKMRKTPVETLIVPASGFYANDFLKLSNQMPKKIIYYDFSPTALLLKKHINKFWNGSSELEEIYQFEYINKKKAIHPWLQDFWKDKEEWIKYWNFFKSIEKKYVQIDLLQEHEGFISNFCTEETTWLWISNIFTYNVNSYLGPPSEIFSNYYNFLRNLKLISPEIYVSGKSPFSRYFCERPKTLSQNLFGFSPSWERPMTRE